MKTYSKQLIGALLAIIMVVSIVPNGISNASATNASTQSDYVTSDIITFGSYPQTRVTDTSLITALNLQPLQTDNTTTYNGSKYMRVYFTSAYVSEQATNGYFINTAYWFKFEPIQWRILSNTNGELFVLAEKILMPRAYHQHIMDINWTGSTLRMWLNNDFYNTAFNSTEQAKIKTSTVVNSSGIITSDKLFLLSFAEAMNPEYGFSESVDSNSTRLVQGTHYAKSQGLRVNLEYSPWWLRSRGQYRDYAGYINEYGGVDTWGTRTINPTFGVLPVFKINQHSEILTPTEGTDCIVDYIGGRIFGLAPGTTSLNGYANVAEGYELSYILNGGFGTGSIANVTATSETVESYTIIIFGDIDGNGLISPVDALMTLQNASGLAAFDDTKQFAGDVNYSGDITSLDALRILQYASGLITEF